MSDIRKIDSAEDWSVAVETWPDDDGPIFAVPIRIWAESPLTGGPVVIERPADLDRLVEALRRARDLAWPVERVRPQ